MKHHYSLDQDMVMWVYRHVLLLGECAGELRVCVPSVGDPFSGSSILLQKYIENINKDGW